MNLKAIIFDLDGVITETAHLHYQSWSRIAKQFNYELTEEDNLAIKGLSRRASLDKVLAFSGVELAEEKIQELLIVKNDHYQHLLNDLSNQDTLPGFNEFFAQCSKEGLLLAVGSASKNAKIILKKLGKQDDFDAIVDGHMVEYSKPNPEVFLNAAKLMNVHPNETVVFEDAIAGVEAANEGGFFSIGVGKEANLGHADAVIPSLKNFTFKHLNQIIQS